MIAPQSTACSSATTRSIASQLPHRRRSLLHPCEGEAMQPLPASRSPANHDINVMAGWEAKIAVVFASHTAQRRHGQLPRSLRPPSRGSLLSSIHPIRKLSPQHGRLRCSSLGFNAPLLASNAAASTSGRWLGQERSSREDVRAASTLSHSVQPLAVKAAGRRKVVLLPWCLLQRRPNMPTLQQCCSSHLE